MPALRRMSDPDLAPDVPPQDESAHRVPRFEIANRDQTELQP